VVKAHRRRKGSKRQTDTDTVLVYFRLEDEKRQKLEAIAAERGVSFDKLVSQGVELLLIELRLTGSSSHQK
jgi:hypothetical protein